MSANSHSGVQMHGSSLCDLLWSQVLTVLILWKKISILHIKICYFVIFYFPPPPTAIHKTGGKILSQGHLHWPMNWYPHETKTWSRQTNVLLQLLLTAKPGSQGFWMNQTWARASELRERYRQASEVIGINGMRYSFYHQRSVWETLPSGGRDDPWAKHNMK